MQLFGIVASPYVARVVLFARLKGIDLPATLPEGGMKSESFMALNPMGKMPVLVNDGVAIAESAVICELLEDLYPGTGGLPGTPTDRARARLVTRVYDLYVAPHLGVMFRNLNPAGRDATALAAATAGFETGLGYLQHFVQATPYAAGAQPSLADCTLLPAFVIMQKTIIPALGLTDPTAHGKFGSWWSTLANDPVFSEFLPGYAVAVDDMLRFLARR